MPASDDERREATEAALREPRAWLFEADQLKRAVDVVGNRFEAEANEWLRLAAREDDNDQGHEVAFSLAPAYLMLVGYAIENLAKGLIVARDGTAATLNWVSTNHLDAAMLERAGVVLVDASPTSWTASSTESLGRAGTRRRTCRPRGGLRTASMSAVSGATPCARQRATSR